MKIVITGDTHVPQRATHIPQCILEAVADADLVIHTGDFNSKAAYEIFANRSKKLYAVRGNRDEGSVEDLLPQNLAFEIEGLRTTLLHGHTYGRPRPSRLVRELGSESDLIIYGHIHRPAVVHFQGCTLINPGSPTDPRGSDPSYISASVNNGTIDAKIICFPIN